MVNMPTIAAEQLYSTVTGQTEVLDIQSMSLRAGPEYRMVERPLVEQLVSMGWQMLDGDISVPYLTERQSFRDVLLGGRLRTALRTLNLTQEGKPWLDEGKINQAVSALERLGPLKLMEANQAATELLLRGTTVEGADSGRNVTIKYIDFDHPERNDFLVISQFRVDPPWAVGDREFIVPDLVLFVNGIPLVVVEAKSPAVTNPIEEAITQSTPLGGR
jgi:type I restriction enzyme R subunit